MITKVHCEQKRFNYPPPQGWADLAQRHQRVLRNPELETGGMHHQRWGRLVQPMTR